jgi:hypothetical protein
MAGVQWSAQKTVENQMGSVQESNIPYTKSDRTQIPEILERVRIPLPVKMKIIKLLKNNPFCIV